MKRNEPLQYFPYAISYEPNILLRYECLGFSHLIPIFTLISTSTPCVACICYWQTVISKHLCVHFGITSKAPFQFRFLNNLFMSSRVLRKSINMYTEVQLHAAFRLHHRVLAVYDTPERDSVYCLWWGCGCICCSTPLLKWNDILFSFFKSAHAMLLTCVGVVFYSTFGVIQQGTA
jgi:hypothetical protein